MSDVDAKREEIARLRERARELEQELAAGDVSEPFAATGFYAGYHATAGFMLGMFGAATSLLFNIVGSLLTAQHPLQLIRVYLTFPLGDQALESDTGLALAVGCCLYLGTGMLLGIVFQLALAKWAPDGPLGKRIAVASILAIVVWLINFYGILSWLQPLLIDMSEENLIVRQTPWWVAALTHLVFGWTMALVYPLGSYVPYRRHADAL